MSKLFCAFTLLSLVLIASCMKNDPVIIEQFNTEIKQIQSEVAPDLSIEVFNFRLSRENGEWQLNGEYTAAGADQAVIQLADSLLGANNYSKKLTSLPDSELGDSTYAIVKISTANLRRMPKHASELVNQAILGNILKLLKKKGMWYLVQTEYGYLGWMTRYSFQRTDINGLSQWQESKRVRVSSLNGFIYSEPSDQSIPVSDVTLNSTLKFLGKKSNWVSVELPDGKTGYIDNKHVNSSFPDGAKLDATAIIKTAKSMMGVPYLWGGNSTKGNDCSGFTQTVFRTHGKLLPRDARQQVFLGDEIVPDDHFSNVKAGDLLFFGTADRITHVGISLGGYDFIHQDSQVNMDSFDENAKNFNPFRKRSLKKIKRIIF